jgi:predicted O-methyltransferase YrrM
MRDIGHWTPRTIGDRVRAVIDRSRNEEKPWLTPAASEILSSLLRSRDVGVEFGSGHSTLWFARRVARLTSVEHDRDWHTRVAAWLEREAIDNVDHRCVGTELAEEEDGAETAYAAQARRFDEGSLDFALVNGVYRSACATAILSKLRPGGVLVVENVNWFLPSDLELARFARPRRRPRLRPLGALRVRRRRLARGLDVERHHGHGVLPEADRPGAVADRRLTGRGARRFRGSRGRTPARLKIATSRRRQDPTASVRSSPGDPAAPRSAPTDVRRIPWRGSTDREARCVGTRRSIALVSGRPMSVVRKHWIQFSVGTGRRQCGEAAAERRPMGSSARRPSTSRTPYPMRPSPHDGLRKAPAP